MTTSPTSVITGAFSYTGKYITQLLLAKGDHVRTLTAHPNNPHPFGNRVATFPFHFDHPKELAKSLEGATTLYNTYWIRFSHGSMTYDQAVENTKILLKAAQEAGVRRVVHVSITNPSETSSLPYFRGKAILEQVLTTSSLSYAIVRPTVIFGVEDILVNNVAWLLRHFSVFPIFGSGEYQLQPIYVEDMAQLVVDLGQQEDNVIVDAVGPEVYTFEGLVRLIADVLHRKVLMVHMNPSIAFALAKCIEPVVQDVLITRDEVAGLMANLLISQKPATGRTHLRDWLYQHADTLGMRYASELRRHYERTSL